MGRPKTKRKCFCIEECITRCVLQPCKHIICFGFVSANIGVVNDVKCPQCNTTISSVYSNYDGNICNVLDMSTLETRIDVIKEVSENNNNKNRENQNDPMKMTLKDVHVIKQKENRKLDNLPSASSDVMNDNPTSEPDDASEAGCSSTNTAPRGKYSEYVEDAHEARERYQFFDNPDTFMGDWNYGNRANDKSNTRVEFFKNIVDTNSESSNFAYGSKYKIKYMDDSLRPEETWAVYKQKKEINKKQPKKKVTLTRNYRKPCGDLSDMDIAMLNLKFADNLSPRKSGNVVNHLLDDTIPVTTRNCDEILSSGDSTIIKDYLQEGFGDLLRDSNSKFTKNQFTMISMELAKTV